MDARAGSRLERCGAGADVVLEASREPRDDHAIDLLGDRFDSGEVTRRAVRESRFDDVDLEPCELMSDLQFVLGVERDPRRLLAVAQGRVEDGERLGHTAASSRPDSASTFSMPGAVLESSQPIFERSSAPTRSMGRCCSSSRYSTKFGRPDSLSSIHRFAKVPSWMSLSSLRMVSRVRWSTTLG